MFMLIWTLGDGKDSDNGFFMWYGKRTKLSYPAQQTFTCSKLLIEELEKDVTYV